MKTSGLRGTDDPRLLELAAEQDRILLTHDRNTMPRHLRDRLNCGLPAPAVFILPQRQSAIGAIIESLILVLTASFPEEWRGQIVYLPFD